MPGAGGPTILVSGALEWLPDRTSGFCPPASGGAGVDLSGCRCHKEFRIAIMQPPRDIAGLDRNHAPLVLLIRRKPGVGLVHPRHDRMTVGIYCEHGVALDDLAGRLIDPVFQRPASTQGRPSWRRKRHQTFLPVSQHGSSNDRAGMMQRWPLRHASRKAGFPMASSERQFTVAYFSTGVFDQDGIRPQVPTIRTRSSLSPRRRKGPRARGKRLSAQRG